ncbi:MAG: meaB [Chitinophagaceae bacterium]|nr:meaB [Chitinophagaceae bacterium]
MQGKHVSSINKKDHKALARTISLVENKAAGYYELLQQLPSSHTKVIGITGPPGAGKSTLTDALITEMVAGEKTVAVVCVDPSSPFNFGALLGDRIRMSNWYQHPDVYIRSLATRGSLGGLHPHILEITDVIKAAAFDYLIIETVGVGQSEVEVAGLADVTVVVLVPESGDDIQTMKAGLMEVADIFVVNKADRPGADLFVKNLKTMLAPAFNQHHQQELVIIKAVATEKEGSKELLQAINNIAAEDKIKERKYWLMADKAYHLISQYRMKHIERQQLFDELKSAGSDNLYTFISKYIQQ